MTLNEVPWVIRFVFKILIVIAVCSALLFVVIVVVPFVYLLQLEDVRPLLRSLPSDEEMIAHFKKHRADFERLARIYREDPSVPTNVVGVLLPTPEVQAILDVINVTTVEADSVVWIPPDPYSQNPHSLKEKRRLQGEWFSAERRRFSGVIFSYRQSRVLRLKYMDLISKGYQYFPYQPKVWEGKLILPAHLLGGHLFAALSLDTYPRGFATHDCAYRQIEPHWFIRMCQHPY